MGRKKRNGIYRKSPEPSPGTIPLPNKGNCHYDEEDGYHTCPICMENKTGDPDPLSKHPCTVLFPCLHVLGHRCPILYDCVNNLQGECPLCRKPIRKTFVWRGDQYDDEYARLLKHYTNKRWNEAQWRREKHANSM